MNRDNLTLWKRRLLYFPRLFTRNEKILISLLLIAFLSSSLFLLAYFILKNVLFRN